MWPIKSFNFTIYPPFCRPTDCMKNLLPNVRHEGFTKGPWEGQKSSLPHFGWDPPHIFTNKIKKKSECLFCWAPLFLFRFFFVRAIISPYIRIYLFLNVYAPFHVERSSQPNFFLPFCCVRFPFSFSLLFRKIIGVWWGFLSDSFVMSNAVWGRTRDFECHQEHGAEKMTGFLTFVSHVAHIKSCLQQPFFFFFFFKMC